MYKVVEYYIEKFYCENLFVSEFIDYLVIILIFVFFLDKLMLFYKVDMFFMKIRVFGNLLVVNGRYDLVLFYGRFLMNIVNFVKDVLNIMMENGWMEILSEVVDRENLVLK